jgi:hypothetical protein
MVDNRIYTLAALSCLLSLIPLGPAVAQDDIEASMEDVGERCIDTRRIARTTVVDAETILFYMRGGTIYRNTLPHKCSSLAREKRFSYKTTISRLCDLDVITVLYDYGSGLTSGPSCGLGKFYPVSKEEAEAIRKGPDADIEAEPVEPAEMEQPQVEMPDEKSEE